MQVIPALTWVLVVWAATAHGAPQLRFSEDGLFKIMIFNDLHFGDDPEADERTLQLQRAVLAAEQPALVVFGGDQVTGWRWGLSGRAPGWTEALWRNLTSPVVEAGIPYGVALGNHDVEGELSAREVAEMDQSISNLSLTQPGPEGVEGAANYWLDIYDTAGEDVAARVWVLDSGGRGCGNTTEGWGCVGETTMDWALEAAAELAPVNTSLAVIHIPVPQFLELWRTQPTRGSKGETVGCPLVDTGVYDALREMGVQAVHSGHDHENDFYGVLDGMRLAYGRKSGYGNYEPAQGFMHGARLVQLRLGESAAASETWIRNEVGEREDQGPTPAEAKAADSQESCYGGWI